MGFRHCSVRSTFDTVEKVAAWFSQLSCAKIDLADGPTNRSRVPAKGTKTPENLATERVSDFFNSILFKAAIQSSTAVRA
jgi:hypothetical protein